MKILVGLGNPGNNYKHTRHNIGFSVVDEIARKYSQTTWVKKFNGKFCQCWFEGKKFLLLKPETFMNNSGQSVAAIVAFYKLSLTDLIILHDDLDLKIGQFKIKHNGGHAGHNGVRSIHQAIGSQYTRIRIGVGHPGNKTQVSAYVLSDFTQSERVQMDSFAKDCISGINELLSDDCGNFLKSASPKTNANLENGEKESDINKSKSIMAHLPSKSASRESSFSVLKSIIKKLT